MVEGLQSGGTAWWKAYNLVVQHGGRPTTWWYSFILKGPGYPISSARHNIYTASKEVSV